MFTVPNRINGIDLCSIQLNKYFDASKIKGAGFEFAYIKSSQYSSTKDLSFTTLLDKLSNAGLRVGAYHYCSHDSDPVRQAQFFYRSSGGLGSNPGELPPMADWEFCTPAKYQNHPAHCVEWLETFMAEVERLWYPDNALRLVPRLPVVYSFPVYCDSHQPCLGISGLKASAGGPCPGKARLARYPLNFASYSRSRALPPENHQTYHPVPKPWSRAILTQYSGDDGMPVPGIVGACDRQLFNGSSGEWQDFLGIPRPVDSIERCDK